MFVESKKLYLEGNKTEKDFNESVFVIKSQANLSSINGYKPFPNPKGENDQRETKKIQICKNRSFFSKCWLSTLQPFASECMSTWNEIRIFSSIFELAALLKMTVKCMWRSSRSTLAVFTLIDLNHLKTYNGTFHKTFCAATETDWID